MLDVSAAFASFPVLETPRLILREITPADAERIFAIMRDPQVTRYFGTHPYTDLSQAEQRVQHTSADFAEQKGIRWAITLRESGEFIGSGGFWRLIKEHYRAEVGYELGAAFWGKGYMPEALGAMAHFAFTTLGLNSIEAQIHPENHGSRRALEKSGFVQEAYFRENYYDEIEGRFTDTPVFSLIKREWLQQQ